MHGWNLQETGGPLRRWWALRAAAESAGCFPAGIFPGSDAGAAASGRIRAHATEPGGREGNEGFIVVESLVLAKIHALVLYRKPSRYFSHSIILL